MTLAADIHRTAHLEGEFRLRSGTVSDTYFDKYAFEADPALLARIVDTLVFLVPDGVEVLAGIELGGIPLVTLLSQRTGLPCAFIRKEAKSYGTCRYAEGASLQGKRVALVEDVVSTGGALLDAIAKLKADNIHPEVAIVVIDRETGGAEALRDAGVDLAAAFKQTELESAL
jgi:orotate phosphoribosyltransferase